MEEGLLALQTGARRPDEVEHGETLGHGPGDAVERRELADAKRRDDDGEVVLDAGISVGGVRGVELVSWKE